MCIMCDKVEFLVDTIETFVDFNEIQQTIIDSELDAESRMDLEDLLKLDPRAIKANFYAHLTAALLEKHKIEIRPFFHILQARLIYGHHPTTSDAEKDLQS